jgi:hypothetical protein
MITAEWYTEILNMYHWPERGCTNDSLVTHRGVNGLETRRGVNVSGRVILIS